MDPGEKETTLMVFFCKCDQWGILSPVFLLAYVTFRSSSAVCGSMSVVFSWEDFEELIFSGLRRSLIHQLKCLEWQE